MVDRLLNKKMSGARLAGRLSRRPLSGLLGLLLSRLLGLLLDRLLDLLVDRLLNWLPN